MGEYVTFQTMLLNIKNENAKISDIEEKDDIIYFNLNEHKFQCVGDKVYHKNHPIYDSSLVKFFAFKSNNPNGIIENDNFIKECDKNLELWEKYEEKIYRKVMNNAINLLQNDSFNSFKKYFESYFHIIPEEKTNILLKKIENEKSNK